MKTVKKRSVKSSTTMSEDKLNYLINYLYDYEIKHNGKKPPVTEYSKVVSEWNSEHQVVHDCRYDIDYLIY